MLLPRLALESCFTGSHCGIQRCCQVQQERTCTGKNCDFGRAKEFASWWKTFKNKGPKHIMCHHRRNAILMQTQTKSEHHFTSSVLESCFFLVSAVSPSLAPEFFLADIRLQDPSLCPISRCFLSSSWEIIPTTEQFHRLIYFFEVEGLGINKELIRGSVTVGVL